MLKGDFFSIVDIIDKQDVKTDDTLDSSYTISIALDPAHPIYNGHFPGNPVVPGVCQLRIITEIVSEILKKEVRLMEADTIKFLSMINPLRHEKLTVDCRIRENKDGPVSVSSTIYEQDQVFFKCKAQFR